MKTQDLLSSIEVVTHAARPVADTEPVPIIRLLGVGALGRKTAQLLARNFPIICHEVICVSENASAEDLDALLPALETTDLLFIVCALDDDSDCDALANALGGYAVQAGIWTLAVTPHLVPGVIRDDCEGPESHQTHIYVSEASLPYEGTLLPGPPLAGYAVRHTVVVLTRLLTEMSGICIDFADVRAVLEAGRVGRVGVGVASGPDRGAVAARDALARAESEGACMPAVTGALASVHGSSELTMEDFDEASKVIHEAIPSGAQVVIGLINDELAGGTVKVTVILVFKH